MPPIAFFLVQFKSHINVLHFLYKNGGSNCQQQKKKHSSLSSLPTKFGAVRA